MNFIFHHLSSDTIVILSAWKGKIKNKKKTNISNSWLLYIVTKKCYCKQELFPVRKQIPLKSNLIFYSLKTTPPFGKKVKFSHFHFRKVIILSFSLSHNLVLLQSRVLDSVSLYAWCWDIINFDMVKVGENIPFSIFARHTSVYIFGYSSQNI